MSIILLFINFLTHYLATKMLNRCQKENTFKKCQNQNIDIILFYTCVKHFSIEYLIASLLSHRGCSCDICWYLNHTIVFKFYYLFN
jgi:hypothetical protein